MEKCLPLSLHREDPAIPLMRLLKLSNRIQQPVAYSSGQHDVWLLLFPGFILTDTYSYPLGPNQELSLKYLFQALLSGENRLRYIPHF